MRAATVLVLVGSLASQSLAQQASDPKRLTLGSTTPTKDMPLGYGYSTFKGVSTESGCAAGTVVPAQRWFSRVRYRLTLESSMEEVRKSLEMSFSVSGSYGTSSGSAKARVTESLKRTSSSKYLVVRVTVEGPKADMQNATLTQRASEYPRCGDAWVNAVQFGGELFGVASFEARTQEEERTLDASVRGAVGSVNSEAEFKQRIAALRVQMRTAIEGDIAGGDSSRPLPADLETLLQRAIGFPSEVTLSNAAPIGYELMPYTSYGRRYPSYRNAQYQAQDIQKMLDAIIQRKADYIDLLEGDRYRKVLPPVSDLEVGKGIERLTQQQATLSREFQACLDDPLGACAKVVITEPAAPAIELPLSQILEQNQMRCQPAGSPGPLIYLRPGDTRIFEIRGAFKPDGAPWDTGFTSAESTNQFYLMVDRQAQTGCSPHAPSIEKLRYKGPTKVIGPAAVWIWIDAVGYGGNESTREADPLKVLVYRPR